MPSGPYVMKPWRVSEPTFNATPDAWAAIYEYDDFGRVRSTTTQAGTSTVEYSSNTVVTTTPEGYKEELFNDAGQLLSTTANGKKVTYTYYPSGLMKSSTPQDGQAIVMEYDLQGNRTKITDPDAGIIETDYNGFGELVTEKQKVHNSTNEITTTHYYQPNGLLQSKVRNGETTTYTYKDKHPSTVECVKIEGKNQLWYSYDFLGRIENVCERIKGRVYNTSTTYDDLGRVKRTTYPSGYYTENAYDLNGNLIEVRQKNGWLLHNTSKTSVFD